MIYLILVLFFGSWLAWVIFAKKRKCSVVETYPAGFLIATLSLMPLIFVEYLLEDKVEKKQEQAVYQTTDTGLGLSYSQVFKGFQYYISKMQDSPLATGEHRKMGQSDLNDALFSIEIIGQEDSINRASLMIGLPKNSDIVLVNNLAAIMLFLKNTMPEWSGSVDWLEMAMKSKSADLEKIEYGNKTLSYQHHEALGIMTLSVQNKNHIDK